MKALIALLAVSAFGYAPFAQAVQVPAAPYPLSKDAVDGFIKAVTSGTEQDVKNAAVDDVQVAIIHRNPSSGSKAIELSSNGNAVLASQISLLRKRINNPEAYTCSYDQYFATCKSQIAKGKGSAVISISTNQHGVSFVQVGYATFEEMYKAYVGK